MPTLKHTILCALLLLLVAGLAAQTENWDWSLRAGGTYDDLGEAIATDAEGNCYVAGSFISNAGFGDFSLTGTFKGPEGTLKTTTLIGRVCKRSDALS